MLIAYKGNSEIFSQNSAFESKTKASQVAKIIYLELRNTFDLSDRDEELLESLIYLLMHNVNSELNVFLTIAQITELLEDATRYRVSNLLKLLEKSNVLFIRKGVVTVCYLDRSVKP